ncbi:MAG: VOC family protein [Sinobacteraceae bacterium]|nr:VOC family protein [Nevskiaceae bacterium]
MSLSLGRFHEISISTTDLEASLRFYTLLGFRQAEVLDVWPHPYGVVVADELIIGLHQYRFPSPSFTTVHPALNDALESYREAGAVIAFAKTGPDCFNEFGFRDPAGNMVTLLERATHRHAAHTHGSEDTGETLGRFVAFSLPSAAPEISTGFWQALGATPRSLAAEWKAIGLSAAGLPLAIHDESECQDPCLVFQRRGLESRTRLESTEGTTLMIVA